LESDNHLVLKVGKTKETIMKHRVLQKTNNVIGTWQGSVVVISFVAGVTVMECVAMYHGIDGVLLTTSIGLCAAIVAGFCGIRIGQRNKYQSDEDDNKPIDDDWKP